MFDRLFWKLAAERAVKSFAQTGLIVWGADAANIFTLDWKQGFGTAAAAAFLSLLTSVASEPWGPEGDPSVVQG